MTPKKKQLETFPDEALTERLDAVGEVADKAFRRLSKGMRHYRRRLKGVCAERGIEETKRNEPLYQRIASVLGLPSLSREQKRAIDQFYPSSAPLPPAEQKIIANRLIEGGRFSAEQVAVLMETAEEDVHYAMGGRFNTKSGTEKAKPVSGSSPVYPTFPHRPARP